MKTRRELAYDRLGGRSYEFGSTFLVSIREGLKFSSTRVAVPNTSAEQTPSYHFEVLGDSVRAVAAGAQSAFSLAVFRGLKPDCCLKSSHARKMLLALPATWIAVSLIMTSSRSFFCLIAGPWPKDASWPEACWVGCLPGGLARTTIQCLGQSNGLLGFTAV
jgi:hypothetical protein